jgi:hypothetical protein
VQFEDFPYEHFAQLPSIIIISTWDQVFHFSQPIDYYPYGIVPIAFGQPHHEIHTQVFPWLLWYFQWFKPSLCLLVPWFAALAYVAISNVSVNITSHALPLVIRLNQFQGFGSPWVSSYRRVVMFLHSFELV